MKLKLLLLIIIECIISAYPLWIVPPGSGIVESPYDDGGSRFHRFQAFRRGTLECRLMANPIDPINRYGSKQR